MPLRLLHYIVDYVVVAYQDCLWWDSTENMEEAARARTSPPVAQHGDKQYR